MVKHHYGDPREFFSPSKDVFSVFDIVLNLQRSRYTKEKQTINPIHAPPQSPHTTKKEIENEKNKRKR